MRKPITAQNLRKSNIVAGLLHLGQMIVVLALSNNFTLPITATYMSGPPGTTFDAPVVLFKTPVGLTVAIFLGLSALAHFIVASPKFFPRYSAGLLAQRNYFRWVEYAISSSVMIVLIAQILGVTELAALLALFYLFGIGGHSGHSAPGFVYGIVFSIFALFNSFAIVQWLQYKKVGKWSDYLRGERTYITLSLIAKSLLAWQIFANTLIS